MLMKYERTSHNIRCWHIRITWRYVISGPNSERKYPLLAVLFIKFQCKSTKLCSRHCRKDKNFHWDFKYAIYYVENIAFILNQSPVLTVVHFFFWTNKNKDLQRWHEFLKLLVYSVKKTNKSKVFSLEKKSPNLTLVAHKHFLNGRQSRTILLYHSAYFI
jgi:hypothetical protein